mmetsp:Transcript_23451/g.70228  ORF Transcript_23451/g.70228 Transcript_23451/m.70228 type:complete len:227 (+) Transcript_23451:1639-2319(+)
MLNRRSLSIRGVTCRSTLNSAIRAAISVSMPIFCASRTSSASFSSRFRLRSFAMAPSPLHPPSNAVTIALARRSQHALRSRPCGPTFTFPCSSCPKQFSVHRWRPSSNCTFASASNVAPRDLDGSSNASAGSNGPPTPLRVPSVQMCCHSVVQTTSASVAPAAAAMSSIALTAASNSRLPTWRESRHRSSLDLGKNFRARQTKRTGLYCRTNLPGARGAMVPPPST